MLNTDPFCLDPIEPPEGATDAELLLWAGKCPYCEQAGAFITAPAVADAIACKLCGFEFAGTQPDQGNSTPQRALTAVYQMGTSRGPLEVELPEVSARPEGRGLMAADD